MLVLRECCEHTASCLTKHICIYVHTIIHHGQTDVRILAQSGAWGFPSAKNKQRIHVQWLLSPKSKMKIGCNFPLTFGLKFPHFRTQVPSLASSLLLGAILFRVPWSEK